MIALVAALSCALAPLGTRITVQLGANSELLTFERMLKVKPYER